MTYDTTLLSYFLNASFVVKCVMLTLIFASIFSWTYILQRYFYLKEIKKNAEKFEQQFWSGEDLSKLYNENSQRKNSLEGMDAIFYAGFKEFLRFRKQSGPNTSLVTIVENTQRAMQVAQMREQNKLEKNLQFLAIVGSTSPYVGILGTVWGIMQAFRALAGNVQQATLSMVAPGIAEALIATAIGLFAAIPAVVAYNRFVSDINRLMTRFDAFQGEFINIIVRQSQISSPVNATKFEMAE